MKRTAINFASFYVGSYACTASVSRIGPVAVADLVSAQLPFARDVRKDLRVVAVALLLGTVIDTLFERMGLVAYAGGPRLGPLCPLWISALWVIFASTLTSSLAWLQTRTLYAVLLGAACGPITYAVAARLDAVELGTAGYVAVGIEFAALTPLLAKVAR
ncbi:MAG: DUF2878 domain-containing protein [Planctomycetota bacterium]